MPDIPDDRILGQRENAVQRDCQLHYAEIRGQMAAVIRNRIDNFFPQLLAQRRKFCVCNLLDVVRSLYILEQCPHFYHSFYRICAA